MKTALGNAQVLLVRGGLGGERHGRVGVERGERGDKEGWFLFFGEERLVHTHNAKKTAKAK